MTECFSCVVKTTPLPTGIGTLGNSIGCCKICHVLVCGAHGQRNYGLAEFICVECQPTILAASALHSLGQQVNFSQHLHNLMNSIPKHLFYKSLTEFLEKNPDFKEWLERLEFSQFVDYSNVSNDDELGLLFRYADRESQKLLEGAVILIDSLYREGFPPLFPSFFQTLHADLIQHDNDTDRIRY